MSADGRPLRFCMVTTFYPPYSYGGDATYVRALARSLVALGHGVDVVASTDAYLVNGANTDVVAEAEEDGVRVHRLRHRLGLAAPLLAQQTGRPALYRRELAGRLAGPYDVIHFHNISLMGGPGVLRMGQAGARLYSLHDHWLLCATHIFWKNRSHACDRRTCFSCAIRSGLPPQLWRYTQLRDRHLRHVDRILSPSEFTACRHRELGVRRPIEVLPLFSALASTGEVSPVREESRPFILFAGRVTASKGVATLARVMAAIPDVDLLVIGEGDLRRELQERHRAHSNIRFPGPVPQPELVRHYRQAAAVAVPSIAPETFGLTIVEAAACGTPAIVASGAGGARQLGERCGGLVYDGEEQLAAAIRKMAFNRAFRDDRGRLARARYEQDYTRERHVGAYLGHVAELMREKQAWCRH